MRKINTKKFSERTTINRMMIVVSMLLFSLSIVIQIGSAANIIAKAETIGPFESGHTYQLQIYNYDDVAQAIVNGHIIGPFSGGQNEFVDITQYLTQASDNKIELDLTNNFGGWTYGFQLFKDQKPIWLDACGTFGVVGCMGGDQTLGLVYDNFLTLTAQEPLFVFIRGSDNALWYRTFGNGVWSAWTSLGGFLNSDPDSVNINGDIFVFVQGIDHALWFREYQFQTRQWFDWVSLGGIGTSGPGASQTIHGNTTSKNGMPTPGPGMSQTINSTSMPKTINATTGNGTG